MEENNNTKRKGLKLMPRLLILALIPMLLLSAVAVISMEKLSSSIIDAMVKHELSAAQYAFEVSVNNISNGTYMYTNGKFYKGKRNISENTEFFDNFSKEVDLQVTVFYNDIRVATSLIDENGNRMINTTADPAVYQTVVVEGQDYYSDQVVIAGKEYYAMYCPLHQQNADEIIGMTFVGLDKSNIEAIYSQNLMLSLVVLAAIFVVSVILTIFSVRSILSVIVNVIAGLNSVAEGKLNTSVDGKLLQRADEVGDIAHSVNKLISSLSTIVNNIKGASGDLEGISGNFSDSFKSMTDYIGNVDRAVEEMAYSSTQQAQNTADVGTEVQDMGNAIESTSQNVEQLVGNTDKMREYNKSVDATLVELIKISNETKQAFDVVYEQTNMTNQSALDIQSAADVITDIADQTSLLSLNASIEAARAGEQGKGFAVVADEIRKLADQSAESASRITGIIDMLIKNSNVTVDTMKQVTEVIDKQGAELQNTKSVFSSLNMEINEVGGAVDNIRKEVENLNDLKDNVLQAVESLATLSEENAASTEETSASMQELRNIVNECSNDVDTIIHMSDTLSSNTSMFELD